MTYGDFKDLTRRTAFDKILRDKAFNIAKNTKFDKYQNVIASMVYKVFDKKTSGGASKNEIMSNKELADQLQIKNCTNQLLENLKNEKYNYLL